MIAERLSQFALGDVAGDGALQMMQLSLGDWAACGIAGAGEPVADAVRAMVLAEGGNGAASLFGGAKVPARSAALVNGTISHALDFDDTHFAHIGHPSVAVIPAALAVAEKLGASGAEFLAACLVGVELSIRVGEWLGRAHYQTGFHQTGTAGAYGATAAVGRLLGLSQPEMVQAFGIVSTRASGLKSQFGTMGKPFNAGIAASNGVEAAQLAAAGFISTRQAMDGAQGFGPTHHGENIGGTFDSLGRAWRFETISHKFHACCHGLHAMLEALSAMEVDADAVEAVEVATHPRWLSVCNITEPVTGLEAKFSFRAAAAMSLLGINTGDMASFSDEIAQNPVLVALRDKVRVIADDKDTLTEMQSNVRLKVGGQWSSHFADLNAPMTLDTRRAKLMRKSQGLLGKARSSRVWAAVQAIDIAALTTEMGAAKATPNP